MLIEIYGRKNKGSHLPKSKTRKKPNREKYSKVGKPTVSRHIIPYDPKVAEDFVVNLVEIQASLMADSVLPFLDSFTKERLRASSISGSITASYAELFSHGLFSLSTPSSEMVSWLNEHYLGTWNDPSFAIGSLLENIDWNHLVPNENRLELFRRLCTAGELKEYKLKSGRTITASTEPLTDDYRSIYRFQILLGEVE